MDSPTRQLVNDVLSYRSFVHAVSGAVGGFTAMTAFYPLDTVRTILQVDDSERTRTISAVAREILKHHGIPGLYRGWFPVVTSLWCSNFVYFYSYNLIKITLYKTAKPTSWKDLTAASLAGIINVLVTTPMWVVNTRLKLQGSNKRLRNNNDTPSPTAVRYSGIIDCFRKIIDQEGLAALWNGTVPSLMLVCNPTIQFVMYEALKRRCSQIFQTQELSSPILFLIGAAAKAIATIVTYPVQVLQSRLRAQRKEDGQAKGLLEIINRIIRTTGYRGFYKGIEAKLLQTILMAALMFTTYERISRFVFRAMAVK